MSKTPRVSVVMPVYDGARFLAEAIESVLAQSLSDFELLVVDDGSRDDSAAIARRFAEADARVRLVSLPHQGLARALNVGLERARGEYIARADADDVNLPHRLARQSATLDAAPEVGICGSWMASLDAGELWTRPTDGRWLRCSLLFEVPFYHPTVMLRSRWLRACGCRYDAAFERAEDYDLWERAAALTEFRNLAEPLVLYRWHCGQVSARHAQAQEAATRRVRERALARLGMSPTPQQARFHEEIAAHGPFDRLALPTVLAWLETLAEANRGNGRLPPDVLASVLAARFTAVCARTSPDAVRCGYRMAKTPLVRRHPEVWAQAVRLLVLKHPRLARAMRPFVRRVGLSSSPQR